MAALPWSNFAPPFSPFITIDNIRGVLTLLSELHTYQVSYVNKLKKDVLKTVEFSFPQLGNTFQRDRLQHGLDAGIAISLGLLPVFYLISLQLIMVFLFASVLLRGKQMFTNLPSFGWQHVLLLQFVIYFLLNILFYSPVEIHAEQLKHVALESYVMALFGFAITMLYLGRGRDFMIPLQRWTPLALTLSFLVMSYFFFGPQGARAQAFSTNALVPPMWYLTITLICFCDFKKMDFWQRSLRLALFGSAAVMCLYSGGRMILMIWLFCAIILAIYLIRLRPRAGHLLKDSAVLLCVILAIVGGLYALDAFSGGTIAMRFTYTFDSLRENGMSSTTFYRLELWAAAMEIIKESFPLGVGQINERFLIHDIIERDWLFLSHQTYLSYLVSGGLIALISGILFQSAGFGLFTQATMPAAIGVVVVPALNGLTDSVFQSFFSVQLYMLLILLLVHSQSVIKADSNNPDYTVL